MLWWQFSGLIKIKPLQTQTNFQAFLSRGSTGDFIVSFGGHAIFPEIIHQLKMLGITVDDKLNFKTDIRNMCQTASRQINAFLKLLSYNELLKKIGQMKMNLIRLLIIEVFKCIKGMKPSCPKMCFKIYTFKMTTDFPGANELMMHWHPVWPEHQHSWYWLHRIKHSCFPWEAIPSICTIAELRNKYKANCIMVAQMNSSVNSP